MKWASIFLTALIFAFCAPLFADDGYQNVRDNADKADAELDAATESADEEKKEEEKKDEEKKEEEKKAEEAKKSEENKPSTEVKPEAKLKTEEEKKDVQEEPKKEAEDKKFSVGITNSASHNINKERKSFVDEISLEFGVDLPWEVNASVSGGISYSLDYDRARTNADGSKDGANSSVLDASPVSLSVSRGFSAPSEIKINPNVSCAVPMVSKYNNNQAQIYTIVNGGIPISRSFKLMENLSMTLGWKPGVQYTYAKNEWVWDDSVNEPLYRVNPWTYSSGYSLKFRYKDISLGLGFTQQFVRSDDGVYDKGNENKYTKFQSWKFINIYSANVSYSINDINASLSITTRGRDREYGGYGDDYLYPGDPRFTMVTFNLGYNYSF